MPIITENELRNRIRQPQQGMTLTIPAGTIFSPSALDFIKQWHLDVVEEGASNGDPPGQWDEKPDWDKPSVFPVNLASDLPHCSTCGTALKKKPEHMTQLNATTFAPKANHRIRLRGKLDSLQALCLLLAAMARATDQRTLADLLDSLAAYCREMMSAEYNERPVQPLSIRGLDEAQLRKLSHNPQEAIGIPHLTPGSRDPMLLLWLNYLRCQVRETELVVLDAFGGDGFGSNNYGLVQAVNRFSSAVYYLELLTQRGGQFEFEGK